LTSGDDCEASGKTTITTNADCEAGAVALGFSDKVLDASHVGSASVFDPIGCWYDDFFGRLQLSTGSRSERHDGCSADEICICKSTNRRLRNQGGGAGEEGEALVVLLSLKRRTLAESDEHVGYTTTVVAGTNDLIPIAKNGYTVKKMLASSIPDGCYSGLHIIYAFVSLIVLFVYSFGFPRTMHKVIHSIKPQPIANGRTRQKEKKSERRAT